MPRIALVEPASSTFRTYSCLRSVSQLWASNDNTLHIVAAKEALAAPFLP
jgi:hypothetical protein